MTDKIHKEYELFDSSNIQNPNASQPSPGEIKTLKIEIKTHHPNHVFQYFQSSELSRTYEIVLQN